MAVGSLTGRELGKYKLIRLLGRGGKAEVYLAEHLMLRNRVAVKILPDELSQDRDMVERFLREARAAASLRHPHIVRIHDVGQEQGVNYFAMDYIEGQSLSDLIKGKGALGNGQIISFTTQILKALAEAHGKGIIHRDIKPDNVIIDQRGDAVVMDFGIAKAGRESSVTVEGFFVGTPFYASPEQAQGKPLDKRSDIYSLGVTMYEMASGRTPFHGMDTASTLYQHVHEPPPPLGGLNPNLGRELEAVIHRCLEKEPAKRFDSAEQMLASVLLLESGQEGDGGQTMVLPQVQPGKTAQPPVPPPPPPPRAPGEPPRGGPHLGPRLGDASEYAAPDLEPGAKGPVPPAHTAGGKPARIWLWLMVCLVLTALGAGGAMLYLDWQKGEQLSAQKEPAAPAASTKSDAPAAPPGPPLASEQPDSQQPPAEPAKKLAEPMPGGEVVTIGPGKEAKKQAPAQNVGQAPKPEKAATRAGEKAEPNAATVPKGPADGDKKAASGPPPKPEPPQKPEPAPKPVRKAEKAAQKAAGAGAAQPRPKPEPKPKAVEAAKTKPAPAAEPPKRAKAKPRARAKKAESGAALPGPAGIEGDSLDPQHRLEARLSMMHGVKEYNRGNYQTAAELFSAYLQVFPHDPRAKDYLAKARLQLGEPKPLSDDEPPKPAQAPAERPPAPKPAEEPPPQANAESGETMLPADQAQRRRQARLALVQGVSHFNAGRYADAAREFRLYTRVFPGEPQGWDYLRKAERMMAEKTSGAVVVKSEPPAEVYLDGKPRGFTPITLKRVPVGRRVVEVRGLGGSQSRQINVKGQSVMEVSFTLLGGRLKVESQPAARLWFDQKDMGPTPLALENLPLGQHEIVLKAAGYYDKALTVTLRGDRQSSVKVNLTPLPAPTPPARPATKIPEPEPGA